GRSDQRGDSGTLSAVNRDQHQTQTDVYRQRHDNQYEQEAKPAMSKDQVDVRTEGEGNDHRQAQNLERRHGIGVTSEIDPWQYPGRYQRANADSGRKHQQHPEVPAEK